MRRGSNAPPLFFAAPAVTTCLGAAVIIPSGLYTH